MVDLRQSADPAIGMIELDSIARGVFTGDAMVKAAPVAAIHTGSVHPGRYLVLVSGDTASVEVALEVGHATGGRSVIDSMFLPDVHPDVTAAIVAGRGSAESDGEAVGLVETATVATVIEAADAGVKAAAVTVATVALADGLGGKGYVVFGGGLAEVEVAVESAVARAEPSGHLVANVVVSQLAPEMRVNLASGLTFRDGIVSDDEPGAGDD